MQNLFTNGPKQKLEGGLTNTNSFKIGADEIIMRGDQINERLENLERPNTFYDFQMNKKFENLNINDPNNIHYQHMLQNNNTYDQIERTWMNQIETNINTNNIQQNTVPQNQKEFYYQPNMMGYGMQNMQNSIHPMLMEFNRTLEQEKLGVKEEISINKENTNVEAKEDNLNDAGDLYKDIIRVMEAQGDDRHQNSEFLKFIKKLQSGDIKLNEKENNVEVIKDSMGNMMENNYNNDDERQMEDMWDKLESNLKDIDFDYNNQLGMRDHLFLKDNPYLMNESSNLKELSDQDFIELGKTYLEKNDITNARYAFEAETQKNPDNSEAWLMLGKLHCQIIKNIVEQIR